MRTKDEIRHYVWNELEEQDAAAFPFPPTGRIPNFVGSSRAADQVMELESWNEAEVIKANPDAPQRYLRKLALEQNKVVYMAVPRLKQEQCFVEIDIDPSNAKKAASISGAFDFGVQIHPKEVQPVDLIVTGSVAVNRKGHRIGKGEGYSDLELAILSHFDKIQSDVPIITSVHPIQIISDDLNQDSHDIVLSTILTEEEIIMTGNQYALPEIDWDQLDEEKIAEIPILQSLR